MVMICKTKTTKRGAVSIFLVIFTTLLIGLIALGFVRLMILDKQRAINSDLSDSAYDSTLAGVEDAKRAIIKYEREICATPGATCVDLAKNYLKGDNCDAVKKILDNNADGTEKRIATDNAKDVEQAYTCAKIKYFTDDYIRDLKSQAGEQIMIPLSTTDQMSEMTLEWHTDDDLDKGKTHNFGSAVGANQVDVLTTWPTQLGNMPPVLMIQYVIKGESDARTLYLRPVNGGSHSVTDFNNDSIELGKDYVTTSDEKKPPVVPVSCFGSGSYKCKTKIRFNSTVPAYSRNHFLRITKIYNTRTTIRATPVSGSATINRFNGIQPEIDVTGRANYIFRRLKARVELSTGLFPFPSAALNVGGRGLCKSFEITDYHLKNKASYTPEDGNQSDLNECLID